MFLSIKWGDFRGFKEKTEQKGGFGGE